MPRSTIFRTTASHTTASRITASRTTASRTTASLAAGLPRGSVIGRAGTVAATGLRPARLVPPVAPPVLLLVVALAIGSAALWWALRPHGSVPGSPTRPAVTALLATAHVVPERVKVPGYQRACEGTAACVFGPAWSDSTDAPDAGNGCSTRDDVLRRDIRDAAPAPADHCRIRGGTLVDPYTGTLVDVARVGLRHVHIDHVFPLAAAWDLGAAAWPARLRARFANDTEVNLVAVGERVNEDKGDSTPGEWMPPNARWHCVYAARYLTVAVGYGLAVSEADRRALATAARHCPG